MTDLYRNYKIRPGYAGVAAFYYQHQDEESLCGYGPTVEACKAEIDERIAEWGWRS